jgi:hypothetical protein
MGYQRSELGEIDSTYHRLTVHRDTQYIKTEVVRVRRECGRHVSEGSSGRWSDRRPGVRRLARVTGRGRKSGWQCRPDRWRGCGDASARRADGGRRHRPPFDAEPGTQLVHRRSSLVTGDAFLNLVGVESAGSPWLERSTGSGIGLVGSGSFRSSASRASPLGFCVVISSPKVHSDETSPTGSEDPGRAVFRCNGS